MSSASSSSELILTTKFPLKLHTSQGCGNYFISSRTINKDEIIFEEQTLLISPYGYENDTSPYCLSCYKDLSYSQKCKICHWPICNETCSQVPQHSNYECHILATNKVQYKQKKSVLEYLGMEILRCLLLRHKNILKWKQLLNLEGHVGLMNKKTGHLQQLSYVINFIKERCKLQEFDEETIVQIFGIICINSFSGFQYLGRHVSLLFAQASLFNHDCTPNTTRRFLEFNDDTDTGLPSTLNFSIQMIAARSIMIGEVISTHYGDITHGIIDRGSFLKDYYFFHCDCQRCRLELFNEIQYLIPDIHSM